MVESSQVSADSPVFAFFQSLDVDFRPRDAVEAYYQTVTPVMGMLVRDSIRKGDRAARWQPDHSMQLPIAEVSSLSATCMVDLDHRTGTARRVQLKANTDGTVGVSLSFPDVFIEKKRDGRFAYTHGTRMMSLPEYVSRIAVQDPSSDAAAILSGSLVEQAQFALRHARRTNLPATVR